MLIERRQDKGARILIGRALQMAIERAKGEECLPESNIIDMEDLVEHIFPDKALKAKSQRR